MLNSRRLSLFAMLICLALLFIVAQVALFFIHDNTSELVDSLAHHSIARELCRPVILFPILIFIFIQLMAYVLLICWTWFLATSLKRLLTLSDAVGYWCGVILWFIVCTALLFLNSYYYPHSFFALFFPHYPWINNIILIGTIAFLGTITFFAYVYFFWRKQQYDRYYRALGWIFILLGLSVSALFIYDERMVFNHSFPYTNHTKPNIILIGLDSLRPDFTHSLGTMTIHTPHIDAFLNSGTVFTQAYSPLARTFPAWVSILTAKYPKHHQGRINLADPTPILRNETLTQKLKTAGYFTMYGTDEVRFTDITSAYGFDRLIGPPGGAVEFLLGGLTDFPLTNLLANLPFGRFLFPYHYGNRAIDLIYKPNHFLQLIKIGLVNRPNKPVFLALHLCLAHWPFTWAQDGQPAHFILPDRYKSSVEALDAQFGKLLQLLKMAGLLDHSLVVLFSDHGTTLGLPGDRLVDEKHYRGHRKNVRLISAYKLSSAPAYRLDLKRDYSINTSYGQGTDILSLKQNQVVLGFRGFGIAIPSQQIKELSSLLDIAPTILDRLHLKPLKQADGVSLYAFFSSKQPTKSLSRPFFIETADTIADMESDKIVVDKIVKQMLGAYQINPQTGLLTILPDAKVSIIKNKQRAILWGNWLLARYPAQTRFKLVKDTSNQKQRMKMQAFVSKPFFVLVHLKTGLWTTELSSSFAKTAPLSLLMTRFNAFYGDEI